MSFLASLSESARAPYLRTVGLGVFGVIVTVLSGGTDVQRIESNVTTQILFISGFLG